MVLDRGSFNQPVVSRAAMFLLIDSATSLAEVHFLIFEQLDLTRVVQGCGFGEFVRRELLLLLVKVAVGAFGQ